MENDDENEQLIGSVWIHNKRETLCRVIAVDPDLRIATIETTNAGTMRLTIGQLETIYSPTSEPEDLERFSWPKAISADCGHINPNIPGVVCRNFISSGSPWCKAHAGIKTDLSGRRSWVYWFDDGTPRARYEFFQTRNYERR